jgi:beta-glucanase (GH16 family)
MITQQRPGARRGQHASRNRVPLLVATVASAVFVCGLLYAFSADGPPHAQGAPGPASPLPSASAPTTSSPSSPPPVAWQRVWTADFDGPAGAGVSPQVWKYDLGTGVFGTHEVETMTDSTGNVHLDGQGGLDITALGPGAQGVDNWTSGRIQTTQLFAPPPGKEMMVTASIRQPDPANGLGYWPGFWMLGPNPWPTGGEIDILEDENGLSTHSGTLHCGNLTQSNGDGTFGPCHEGYGLGSGRLPCPGCQTGFHTYSVIIDRRKEADQQISWYLDGAEFFSVDEAAVGQAAWTAAVDHGFTIILDVAIGGSYPDIVCQCTSPSPRTSSGGTMTVRQLSVYVS